MYGTSSHIHRIAWHSGVEVRVHHDCRCHMESLEWRLKWGQGLGGGPLLSNLQMYNKDRQCGFVGIILFFFVNVNFGKDGSFHVSIAENIGKSPLLVEFW